METKIKGDVVVEGDVFVSGSINQGSVTTWEDTASDWPGFTGLTVNTDGTATRPALTSGGYRATATAPASTDGNRRDLLLADDTVLADSEICTLNIGGDVYDSGGSGQTAQMGHAHRVVEISPGTYRAIVITNNIFLTAADVINCNVWQFNGGAAASLILGSNGASKTYGQRLDRQMQLTSRQRVDLFDVAIFSVSEPWKLIALAAGELVTTDSQNAAFDFANAALASVDYSLGTIAVPDATAADVAPTFDYGTITPAPNKRVWPYWMKSRVIGTKAYVKCWPYGRAEPAWSDSSYVLTADFAGANNPSPLIAAPPSGEGQAGLVIAHMRNSHTMIYGPVSIGAV